LRCFDQTKDIKFYFGTDTNIHSKKFGDKVKKYVNFVTKPVKYINQSIDVSSLSNPNDRSIIKDFIKRSLLEKLSDVTVVSANNDLKQVNLTGQKIVQERKCNFDVEI
jgi:hypothetical protein